MTRRESPDGLAVSPDTLKRLEADANKADPGNGMGNLLGAIDANLPAAIADKKAERAQAARRVLELSAEIARLETHQLIGDTGSTP